MVLVEEVMGKMQVNGPVMQKNSGNREQQKAERQWKHRNTESRKTVETQNNRRQKDSGNIEQQEAERQWKHRTTGGRKTVET